MRRRIKHLVIGGIIGGLVLLVATGYQSAAGIHRLPLALGWIASFFGLLFVTGILTISGLVGAGRHRIVSFVSAGLLVFGYAILLFQTRAGWYILIVESVLFFPYMAALLLVTALFLWKSVER